MPFLKKINKINSERNETKGFYNDIDAGLFNKDIVLYLGSYCNQWD